MKLIKKSPLFCILISTGIFFSLIGFGGLKTIYSGQELNFLKNPVLTVVFTGIHDEIYPWQTAKKTKDDPMPTPPADYETVASEDMPLESADVVLKQDEALPDLPPGKKEQAADTNLTYVRPAPLRESTYEEYMNHISADIYGDVGVLHAAEYEFTVVDESYFDDALFIGDSRMVGLHDYTDLSEHADFLCETSLTIHKVFHHEFKDYGMLEEVLENKDYGKIYISLGINELGTGTTESFMEKYTEVVDTLCRLEPEAKIFIIANMHVAKEKHESDAIFNNRNINARNHAIATLADNEQVFYIDVNEAVCDEEGNLTAEYTFDQLHLLGVYNDIYKQFLLEHAVK